MTPEQEKDYWEYLSEILVRYYDRKRRIFVKIRQLKDSLVWNEVDRKTEVERLKKIFGLPYEPLFSERRTRDELFEEAVQERDFQPASVRGRPVKVRPIEVLPKPMLKELQYTSKV